MILFDDDRHWEHICHLILLFVVLFVYLSGRLGNDINQHREDNDDDE